MPSAHIVCVDPAPNMVEAETGFEQVGAIPTEPAESLNRVLVATKPA